MTIPSISRVQVSHGTGASGPLVATDANVVREVLDVSKGEDDEEIDVLFVITVLLSSNNVWLAGCISSLVCVRNK